jgi:pantothenate synthetase
LLSKRNLYRYSKEKAELEAKLEAAEAAAAAGAEGGEAMIQKIRQTALKKQQMVTKLTQQLTVGSCNELNSVSKSIARNRPVSTLEPMMMR